MLTGENGILAQVKKTKEETKEANEEELRKLTRIEATMQIEDYEYTDINGEKVKIPEKCAVSHVEGENTIEKGLVIIDVNGNEWVWIEVPEFIYSDSRYNDEGTPVFENDFDKIEKILKNYANEYRTEGNDIYYSKELCGLDEGEYLNLKQNMLKSIYINGGFFIGRYEAGTNIPRKSKEDDLTNAIIQRDAYPYNYISCAKAQTLSMQLSQDGTISSLMFGIQWDLVLKYLEENATELGENKMDRQNKIKIDSTSWGNYKNSIFVTERGKYNIDPSNHNLWNDALNYSKTDLGVLFTTGITDRNKVLNIYDLAGNVRELTLEYSNDTNYPTSARRGHFYYDGEEEPICESQIGPIDVTGNGLGFRPSLYLLEQ